MPTTSREHAAAGFTMIELIVVLLVVTVIGIGAAPRIFDNQAFVVRGFFDATLAQVRYAQKLAVAQRRTVYVNVAALTNTVCLGYDGTDANCTGSTAPVTDPGSPGARYLKTAPRGVTFGVAAVAFGFDGLGRPTPDTSYAIDFIGDNATRTMRIERETGYVR